MAAAAKVLFLEMLELMTKECEVRLPRTEGHPPWPTNMKTTEKRSSSAMRKFKNGNLIRVDVEDCDCLKFLWIDWDEDSYIVIDASCLVSTNAKRNVVKDSEDFRKST